MQCGFLINLLRLKYFKEGSKLWCLQIPQVELFFEGHDDSKQFLISCVTLILDGTFPELGTFDRFLGIFVQFIFNLMFFTLLTFTFLEIY